MKAWIGRWGYLAIVLLSASVLRLDGLRWDDGIHPHPDERYMTMLSAAVHTGALTLSDRDEGARSAHQRLCVQRYPESAGVGGWFDSECSDFNPDNVGYAHYAYGQLPLTMVRLGAEWVSSLTAWNSLSQYEGIQFIGRAFSALADLLTLSLVFLLGRLAWNRRVGVLAAAFYALAVLPVQLSHFWTVDTAATLFSTAGLLFLVRFTRRGEPADALAFGCSYGLALASKISLLPLAGLLPLALYLAPKRGDAGRIRQVFGYALSALLFGLGAWLTFRIASPFAFSSALWSEFGLRTDFVGQVLESRRLASGVVDIPPNWQWLGRIPWLWSGQNLIVWGLGPLLGSVSVVAVCCLGWRLLRASSVQRGRAMLWLWCVGYFVWMGQQWAATMRYLLPIYPVLCLFAAALIVSWIKLQRRRSGSRHLPNPLRARLPSMVLVLILITSSAWALAFHKIHRTLHPYLAATHWILRHVPGPVSSVLKTENGRDVLINWPASGEYGDGVPARVAARTVAPTSGLVGRLRFDRLKVKSTSGALVLFARVLDVQGRVLASTSIQDVDSGSEERQGGGIELAFPAPLQLQGGEIYQLQIEARGGVLTVEGSRIANEGAWNDSIPARVPWLPPADTLDLQGNSGTVPMGALRVDPYAEGYYTSIDLGMTGEDDEGKRLRLLDALDRADWVVIPNNRFYDSMIRNPLRYPLSSKFYDELFSGRLGFSCQLEMSSMPSLAGISLRDQALPKPGHGVTRERSGLAWGAEEAFSVYDHPTVFIFQKTSAYSRASVERSFTELELRDVRSALSEQKPRPAGRLSWPTLEASYAPTGLLLPEPSQSKETGDGAGRAVVAEADQSPILVTIVWYLCATLLGLLAWPILCRLWPGLADGGYGVSRIAGLIMLVLPAWWMLWLGVPAWSGSGLTLVLIALCALSAWQVFRCRRNGSPAWRVWLGSFVRIEGVFLASFALGLLLRVLSPDLWAPGFGGEKPMDYAYLNSVLAAESLPPADPWFSGGRLNYYYFGWMLVGGLTKLSGATPALAYNLALASWFAMTATGAFSLAWNVCQSSACGFGRRSAWIAGCAALAAAVLLGNLDLPRALAPNIKAAQMAMSSDAPATPRPVLSALTEHGERWLWAPSRTVGERPGTSHEVNEFPAFSFLYGDLHPHLMALPLQLLLLTALLALVVRQFWTASDWRAPPRWSGLTIQIFAVAIGLAVLRSSNSWDWPLYLGLSCLVCLASAWHWAGDAGLSRAAASLNERWAIAGLAVLMLLGAQALVALPFSSYFTTGPLQIHLFNGKPTALVAWGAMQGWFLIVIVAWCWALSRGEAVTRETMPRFAAGVLDITALSGLIYTLLVWAMSVYRGAGEVPAIGMQIALLAWIARLFWQHAGERRRAVGLALALVGVGLALIVEIVVVGEDIGRMNTFFKFHMQSWILLSVSSGIALAELSEGGLRRYSRRAFFVLLSGSTALAMAYTPFATYGRMQTRFNPDATLTLDGEAFLSRATYEVNGVRLLLADDYRMIRWLREHADSDDVLLEAQLPEYRWGSRVSVFTGRPTVLGYRPHQSQQRPLPALREAIELRKQNIEAIYEAKDASQTLQMLRHYGVRFVIVGGLERAVYSSSGLAALRALAERGDLEVAYSAGEDVIYRRPQSTDLPGTYGARW